MGLEDAPHFAVGNPGSCLKGSCDLCGMVGIVIHNGDAAYGAFVFKASAGAAKFMQGLCRGLGGNGQDVCQGNGRHGIIEIVYSGYLQGKFPKGGLGAVEHEPGVSHLVKRYT